MIQLSMNVLFVHQNFPGQFKHLAPALAKRGDRVVALHINPAPEVDGVTSFRYTVAGRPSDGTHRWLRELEVKTLRAEAAWRAALQIKSQGFEPDVIVAHPAWGESLFLKRVWPRAKLGIYCEYFYHAQGADVGFDPEFAQERVEDACRLQMKNANYELHFGQAQAGIAPTHWQASLFPGLFASRISVIHDGIDTEHIVPNQQARVSLQSAQGALTLSHEDEVITFVNRNLEPYRGYHRFMRALPAILRERRKARVLLIGGNEVSYGAPPPVDENGQVRTWRDIFLSEVREELDMSRVHFLGKVPYADFLRVMQISTVHAYLTYPFVLSWSLLEAMSSGCAIVASNTAPVREAIQDDETGLLVDFFDGSALADRVIDLCKDQGLRERLGQQARASVQAQYDLKTQCLPKQLAWVDGLAATP